MLKKIYEQANLVQTIAPIQEILTMKGIYIVISGTNGATPFTKADVGRVLLEKGGQEIINASAEFLHANSEIVGGFPEFTSSGSSAGQMCIYIPFRMNDRNVMTFIPADNAILKIDHHSNLDTRIASAGKVTIYADVDRGVQLYDMKYVQYSYSLTDGQEMPIDIQQDNIMMSLLSDSTPATLTLATTNMTTIQTEIDEYNSRLAISDLKFLTAWQHELESAYVIAGVHFHADGDFTSRLSDAMKLNITSSGGVATPEILVVSAKFDPVRMSKTKTAQVKRLQVLTDRKVAFNKKATVQSISQMKNF